LIPLAFAPDPAASFASVLLNLSIQLTVACRNWYTLFHA